MSCATKNVIVSLPNLIVNFQNTNNSNFLMLCMILFSIRPFTYILFLDFISLLNGTGCLWLFLKRFFFFKSQTNGPERLERVVGDGIDFFPSDGK